MVVFDFYFYIHEWLRKDSISQSLAGNFRIQTLTGGFTNETVRTSFDPPIRFDTTSPERSVTLESVVLKYAPPYLASDPTQPLSVHRQSIEAKALQMLSGVDPGGYPELVDLIKDFPASVRIPRLLYHDIQKNVLWIEDLGNTYTLSEYLLSDASATLSHSDLDSSPSIHSKLGVHAQSTAEDLGRFLFGLYTTTINPSDPYFGGLTSNDSTLATKTYLANMTADILRAEGISDASILAKRVWRGLIEEPEREPCLGMVDFWPESVLIGKDEDTRCGLVDWEYFGVSSASSELGMFRKYSFNNGKTRQLTIYITVAHLHFHMLNSTSPAIKERITSFSTSMLNSYSSSHPAVPLWAPSANFKRRLLLSHGRELINGIQMYNKKLNKDTKMKVLQAGVRSLRAAGEADDELNLQLIKENNDSGDYDSGRIWQGFKALRFDSD